MEEETHSTKKTTTRETDWKMPMEETLNEFYWKMLMEETLEAFSNNTIIACDDMRIISKGNQETQDIHNDEDNDDTQSNGRGVTNGYAVGSDMDRLTGTPD